MDKKQVIKTVINVLPIFIVPLVVERKKIKSHPDVQKASHATSHATHTVANKASDVKDYFGDKKQEFDNKRELKKIAKENDPKYIKKKGSKLAKKNHKQSSKLEKKLERHEKVNLQTVLDQLYLVLEEVFPNGSFQERRTNFSEYYLEDGKEFFKQAYDKFEPLEFEISILNR